MLVSRYEEISLMQADDFIYGIDVCYVLVADVNGILLI